MHTRDWNVGQLVVFWVAVLVTAVVLYIGTNALVLGFLAETTMERINEPSVGNILVVLMIPLLFPFLAIIGGLVVTWKWFGSRKPSA